MAFCFIWSFAHLLTHSHAPSSTPLGASPGQVSLSPVAACSKGLNQPRRALGLHSGRIWNADLSRDIVQGGGDDKRTGLYKSAYVFGSHRAAINDVLSLSMSCLA